MSLPRLTYSPNSKVENEFFIRSNLLDRIILDIYWR